MAATAPRAMLSFAQRIALRSTCSLSIAAAMLLALSISQLPLCTLTMIMPAAFMASSNPSRRCWPLKAVGVRQGLLLRAHLPRRKIEDPPPSHGVLDGGARDGLRGPRRGQARRRGHDRLRSGTRTR